MIFEKTELLIRKLREKRQERMTLPVFRKKQ